MTKEASNRLLAIIKQPWFIIFCLSILILSFNILFIAKYRPFNSDDVYWQLAVKHWVPFSGDTFFFGVEDVFVILSPFFAFMEYLFAPGRKLLALESLLLVLGSFSLFYFSALYFLKKLKLTLSYTTLLPFVWLASFGYPIVSWYLNSNWRSFEIGFSFATFALIAAICNKDINLGLVRYKALGILSIILTGLLSYSDPYYTYFTIVPLFLLVIIFHWLGKIKKATAIVLYSSVGLSIILSKIIGMVFTAAGAHISSSAPATFVAFGSILDNIEGSLHGLFHIFGADFLGNKIVSKDTLFAVVNAALLSFIIVKIISYRKYLNIQKIKRAGSDSLWPLFFVMVVGMIFAVNTFSTLAGVVNYRFYMMLVYVAIVIFSITIGRLENKKLSLGLAVLLIIATLLNITQTIRKEWVEPGSNMSFNLGNSLNHETVSTVRAQGITKGYANFWEANINTYLADDQITFLPSICNNNGKTVRFTWLTTSSQFNKPASSSFYFIGTHNSDPKICSLESIIGQFGKPKQTLSITSGTLLIYDYDISSKM